MLDPLIVNLWMVAPSGRNDIGPSAMVKSGLFSFFVEEKSSVKARSRSRPKLEKTIKSWRCMPEASQDRTVDWIAGPNWGWS